MDLHLEGKTALVTGGSRGLGRAIAITLAREGADVAIAYRSRTADAESVVEEIRTEHGRRAIAVPTELTDEAAVARLFDETEAELAPPDVVVHNAGTWPKAFVHDMTLDEWNETIAVNMTAAFLVCREAVRRWIASERAGSIVNITSQAAHHGATSGHSHYAAAKAGVTNFTHSLAREAAEHGIRVNAVAPGVMPTEMIRDALNADADRYLSRIPLRRWGDPTEIAAAVAFLASDQASYITGATLDVNGGMVMR